MRDRTPHKFGGIDGQSDEEENQTQGRGVDESDARGAAEAFKGKNTSLEDLKADEADSRCTTPASTKAGHRTWASALAGRCRDRRRNTRSTARRMARHLRKLAFLGDSGRDCRRFGMGGHSFW